MSRVVCQHGCGKEWIGNSNRTASQPLDPEAVDAANQASAANCPRLSDPSPPARSLTMSDDDYPCRRVWMDAYLAAVDSRRRPTPVPDPDPGAGDPDDPVLPCERANLAVRVTDLDGNPVPDVIVEVEGLGAIRTDEHGIADFGEVIPGDYTITAQKDDHRPELDAPAGPDSATVNVPACQTTVVPMTQDPLIVIKKHNIVFIGSEMHYDSPWLKMMFIAAAYPGIRGLRSADMKTIAYVNNDYTRFERLTLDHFRQTQGFRIVRVSSASDIADLFNERHESVEDGRTIRYLLQDVQFFSHGLPGSIRLDYDGDDNASLDMSGVSGLAADAFLPGAGKIVSYACRTGVSEWGESFDSDADAGLDGSLAQAMANHFDVEVHAFLTRSFYGNVLRDRPDSARIATAIQTGRVGHEGEVIDVPPEHEALPHPGLADGYWDGAGDEGTSEYALWRKAGGRMLPESHSTPAGLTQGLHIFRKR